MSRLFCWGLFMYLLWVLCWLTIIGSVFGTGHPGDRNDNSNQVITIIHKPIVVDKIARKQKQMRNTTVLVQVRDGSGSGTIIDCIDIDNEEKFEYRVLTNKHVINSRFITLLKGVNSLTGELQTETIDMGCEIITFDHDGKKWNYNTARVIIEDVKYDLAILSFVSKEELFIAKMASVDMLQQVRVFDEIFVIGCQLGCAPTPTTGIISQILIGEHNTKEWVIYSNTAQITPGSSGGGLFKEYENHYYLIGIPYRVAKADNGQFVSHLAYAISITTASNLIESSYISK